ncbi:MAG: hypothetical protein NTZ50_15945 [Chloroflexi bacterium]|nr:hypothetical protein [Chloroflexota bacterium]
MIFKSRYKDQPAVTLESGALRAQFLPSIGGKLCSLVYMPQQFDVLIHKPGDHYRLQPYDGVYVDGECSGLDDMFPTIDACHCEQFPWQGTRLPDHGEVWSLPWETTIDGERLHMSVHGVRLPYRLEKTISFTDAHTLHIEYALENFSQFGFDCLWAAHPMFVLDEDCEIDLPQSVQKIVNVFSSDGSLGKYGDEFDWPLATQPNGELRDLHRVAPPSAARTAKFYVKGRMPEGWCALTYPSRKLRLRMNFNADVVPYLGILPNENGFQNLYNMFLEPATSSFDRPDVARLRGEGTHLSGGETRTWHLDITLIPHPFQTS